MNSIKNNPLNLEQLKEMIITEVNNYLVEKQVAERENWQIERKNRIEEELRLFFNDGFPDMINIVSENSKIYFRSNKTNMKDILFAYNECKIEQSKNSALSVNEIATIVASKCNYKDTHSLLLDIQNLIEYSENCLMYEKEVEVESMLKEVTSKLKILGLNDNQIGIVFHEVARSYRQNRFSFLYPFWRRFRV